MTAHSEDREPQSMRKRIWAKLDKNPLLKPKDLCKLLGLRHSDYKGYVTNQRSLWKAHTKKQQGLKFRMHAWRGWIQDVPKVVLAGRVGAVKAGWRKTKSRNRWFLWKDKLGRLMWFETGRINLYVRAPATKGKTFQLVCNAFSFTGLVTDMDVLRTMLQNVRFKGAHYVFPTGHRMPLMTIDLFSKSNGVIIKVGDLSDPSSIEVQAQYPDWGEQNERLSRDLQKLLTRIQLGISPPDNGSTEKDGDRFYVS